MKTFLRNLKLVILLFILSVFSFKSMAQCGTGTNMGSISPMTTYQNVTGNAGTMAYWSFTGNSGSQYEFHNCNGTAYDTYLRIYNTSWTQLAGADDMCGTNAAFTQQYSTRWTCPSTATYYIFLTDYSCVNMTYNQRMDYWSDYNPYNYDAGVSVIVSPATPASPAVNTDITVKIKNFGSITLTTAGIQWKVDNGSVNTYTTGWTGSLAQGSESADITIGTGAYALGMHTIKAWTNNPNNQTDQNNANDTITATFNVCQTVSGTFYIDITGNGDFINFSSALNSLSGCGINGPVTFIVRPGTYWDPLLVQNIPGASATNYIKFLGLSRTGVILTTNANVPTIRLLNESYVTFENMSITNSSSSYAVGVALQGNAHHNNFINCQIEVPVQGNSYYIPVMFANSTYSYSTSSMGCDYNIFRNCTMKGGYFGITMYGNSSNTCYNNYNQFIGNIITDQYYAGFYRYYASNGLVLKNNTFQAMTYMYGYGIVSYYSGGTTIDGNIIRGFGNYGIYLYYENMYNTNMYSVGYTTIVNNMISNSINTSYHYGMYLQYDNNITVQHNTIAINPTSGSYSYSALYLYYVNYTNAGGGLVASYVDNNVFINYGTGAAGCCVYSYYATLASMNYNNYYSPLATYINYTDGYLFSTLFQWKASYPAINVNSYSQDPDVKSYNDLHLNNGSPGLRGKLTTVATDVDNQPRCALASFLGADEPVTTSSPADFITPDTICYLTPITFYNKGNEKSPHIASWFVNNVYKSSDFHYTASFNTPGYDSVKLVMGTCAGTSSKAKRILVATPTKAPATEFVASKNVAEANEPVYINDVSINCPAGWKWEISPDTVMDPATKIMVPSFEWLNNTSDITQNIVVAFKFSGKYSVCLIAENSIGKGKQVCKTDYINVKFIDNMCGVLNRTTESYGSLYDDGGPSGNFTANSTTCKYLIKTCSDDVKLTFREFNLPTGSYLRIYDGINNRGIPLWDPAYGASGITGFMNDPKFDTILWSTKSGMVYVEFQKGTISGLGFKFEWESFGKGNYSKPNAEFTSFDTGCIVYPVAYKNTSTPGPNDLEFYWDFDGNNTIDANTVDGSYLPTFTGLEAIYSTKLIAENCGGTDTFIKSVVLINPLSIANTSFSANVTQPVIYQDEVVLSSTGPRLECVNKWQWVINPSGKYYYAAGYSNTSQNPRVVFTDTLCYDITLIVGNTNSASTQTMSKLCYIKPITYCTPKVMVKHQDIGISRVKVGSIDNSSAIGVAAYTSYTNLNGTDLFVGQKYDLLVERITNYNAINRKAWIDYNRDGVFDANELIGKQDSTRARTWDESFVVPGNAPFGATILRIGVAYANYANTPCGPNYFGEFEDYRVYVKQDNIPPVITLVGSDTVKVEKGYPYTDDGATALDNIDGNLTNSISISNNVDTTKTGTYYFVFNVCDQLGNCAKTVKRVVIVTEDETAPVLTLLGNNPLNWNVNIPFVDPGYTAFDKGDGDITAKVIVTTTLNFSKLGTYTITYTAVDSKGHKDVETRTVIILDGAMPSISLIGANPIYVNINNPYTEPGVVYADNYWPNNKIVLQVTGLVDVTTVGKYTITYSVTDASNNGPNTISRDVIVYDSVAPVISTSGDDVITIEVYNQFYDPGVNIQDNSINGLTVHKYGNFYDKYPNGYPTKIGNYIIFYYVTDQAGNKSNTLGRIVKVIDATSPQIDLIGADYVFVQRWQTYTDSGYVLSDNYDANKDIVVDVQSNVNTLAVGLYSVCYTATDLTGNQSPSVCRLVRVVQKYSGINNPSASNGVNIYPNPTTGKVMIELKLEKSDNARIVLLNLLGEEVKLISDGTIAASSYEVNMNDLSNGVYMLKVQSDSKTILEKIVLSR